jgi:pimeloyl-ACP methyl ester carboxylesterase
VNYIQNHTALVAVQNGYSTDYLSSKKDIEAAIEWVKQRSDKPVVLFGSSFSASLCLMMAKNNPDVEAVVAFSPGEFFEPEISLKVELKDLEKPVFVAASQREEPYIKEMFRFVPSANKTIFAPEKGPGEHGSKSLWSTNPTSKEYWLALTMFFSKIR